MLNRLEDVFRFHEQALNVRGRRQEILASNIANADTPGYKARDLDFRSALSNALSRLPEARGQLVRTSAAHVSGVMPSADAQLLYRTVHQPSIDGNTVDMDVERAQFADNALRFEANLVVLNGRIKALLAAIQG